MMFLWIALVIVLIVLAVRWIGGSKTPSAEPGPTEALRQRYARGEIDTTEFEDRLQKLRTER